MPQFPNPLQIDVFCHPAAVTSSAGSAVTAGAAFATSVTLYSQAIITQMRCDVSSGAPTGNIDMGIFDATGTNNGPNNLLGHTGAIAATTGIFTQNLTATLTLNPGKYWIAFLDTVADSVFSRSIGVNWGICLRTNATNLTVLGSTFGALQESSTMISVLGLVQGGLT